MIALEHIELVGLPVIDGVPTVANDNVLAAGQADPAHNGIYRVSTTNPGGVYRGCTQSVAKGGRIENVEELALVILGSTDEEVDRALERMRLNFYQLWIVVEELRTSTDPKGLLRRWREAPKGSIGWRNALSYEDALNSLRVSLSD